MGSAAEMSTMKGTRRCWATGTTALVSPELNVPMRSCAPPLTIRSASCRATSGFDCVSPSRSSSRAPPRALIPPAWLMASAASWAPRRQACPGSARGPVTVWITPTLTVGACARRTAGSPRVASPATAPAPRTNDRRPIRCAVAIEPSPCPLPEPQQLAPDDEPLDLVRALINLHDFRVAHETLHRELPRIPDAAEDLDRVGRDLHRRVRREALRHRRLEHGAGNAAVD